MSRAPRIAVLGLLLSLASWVVVVAPASAAQPQRLVTFAARSCPEYTDISANLARNDIQESLRDLGADTTYVAGQPIAPARELRGQPNCSPITDWRFTLGTGFQSRAVSGTWGSLSKVLNPFPTEITTKASVPLLNRNGDATGASLPGAVTIALSDAEAATSQLWAQGGAVDDPVLDTVFPQAYGFGALRCAIDNLNGDNVETVAFPQAVRHVFCFAYYVTPPPTSGTIIVKKQVVDPRATASQSFTFRGNISYTHDHRFSLTASSGHPASTSFIRAAVGAGDPPWFFRELPTPGWIPAGLTCSSATGASATATNVATGQSVVRLAPRDTVTCTYTNRLIPPPAGLVLSKLTIGGTGAFRFGVLGRSGLRIRTIRTTRPGAPVAAAPLSLRAGVYAVAERLPAPSAAGRWTRVRAACDGRSLTVLRTVFVRLRAGEGRACQFTNRFIPAGAIGLSKVTLGGVGTADFQIRPVADPSRSYAQSATTTRPGAPARAGGDRTDQLPLGIYEITESTRAATSQGHWRQELVLCDGRPVGSAQGRVRVRLTAGRPRARCTFTNRFVPGPEPPNPGPAPVPPAGGGGGGTSIADVLERADGPNADISVTKNVVPRIVRPGEPARYTVVVANRGPDTAYDVVVAELAPRGTTQLAPRTTQGTCSGDRPANCRIGTLAAGARAVITVTTRAPSVGSYTNSVSALTSTNDPDLSDNIDSATLLVRRAAAPRYTG